MDIKEIAKRIRKTNNSYMLSMSPDIAAEFAEALVESYKAELLKEVGEPVACRYKDHNGHWCFMGKQYGNNEPLYTSDQLAAAVLKSTKPLEDQLAKAEQLWQLAKGRCDGLEEKLAKAEQRVAEAIHDMTDEVCAPLQKDDKSNDYWHGVGAAAVAIEKAIVAGEWRKFVKEEV